MIDKILKKVKAEILKEATGDSSGSRGTYILPVSPGERLWDDSSMGPFTNKVSKYDNALLDYDSMDGHMDETPEEIKKLEDRAVKIAKWKKKHPYQFGSDDDGDVVNPFMNYNNKIIDRSKVSGPFNDVIGEWVEITQDTIAEDLAVWFGTKKKPKGSSQPKGPWVNICRKKDGGGHPPCGRPEASDKAYPKCRAVGVASKMTDSQKRSACQQKRKVEKTHFKGGKGNKPKMVHYEPKSTKNESLDRLMNKILTNLL